ncbi:glutamate receptor [Senna tora]|uniref:Glutamate receptor n=1 Tax=Senna tora TaxID=362788 RepID=A0A834W5Q4_9FABA|nr:glutamate receptor [Senna tora]
MSTLSSSSSSSASASSNFLLLEATVYPLIKGNRLLSHIDGIATAPPSQVVKGTESIPNPEFEEWDTVDSLLIGWLRNAMSLEVGTQLLHCKKARDLWESAKKLTSGATKSRAMVLKTELHTERKFEVHEYLAKMKNLSDQLTLVGALMPQVDLILHTVNELDVEYNPVNVMLLNKDKLDWEELTSELLGFETRLEQLSHFSSLLIQPSANLAQKEDTDSKTNSGEKTQWQGSRGGGRTNNNNNRGGGRSRGGGRPGGGGAQSGPRPTCQLCGKIGHSVNNCWHRLDKSFNPSISDSTNCFVTPGNASPTAFYAGFLNRRAPSSDNGCIILFIITEAKGNKSGGDELRKETNPTATTHGQQVNAHSTDSDSVQSARGTRASISDSNESHENLSESQDYNGSTSHNSAHQEVDTQAVACGPVTQAQPSAQHNMVTRSRAGVFKPKSPYVVTTPMVAGRKFKSCDGEKLLDPSHIVELLVLYST